MNSTKNDPLLTVSRIFIRIVQAILGIAAVALTIGIPIILLAKDEILAEMREETENMTATFPHWEVAAVMLAALAIVILSFLFLRKLLAIIDTVGAGDPFVPINAERLTHMAWLMVAVQAVTIAFVPLIIRAQIAFEETNPTMDAEVDLGGIVLAITLFILARVFRHGAAMRADLEGTV